MFEVFDFSGFNTHEKGSLTLFDATKNNNQIEQNFM